MRFKNLFVNNFFNSIPYAFSSLGMLFVNYLIAYLFSSEVLGVFALFMNTVIILSILVRFGIEHSINIFDLKYSKDIFIPISFIYVFNNLIFIVINYFYFKFDVYIISAVFIYGYSDILLKQALSKGSIDKYVKSKIFYNYFSFITILLLLKIFDFSIGIDSLKVLFIFTTIIHVIYFTLSSKFFTTTKIVFLEIKYLKKIFQFSFFAFIAAFSSILIQKLDIFILKHYVQDLSLIGIYVIISQLASGMSLINSIFIPKFNKVLIKALRLRRIHFVLKIIKELNRKVFFVNSLMAIGLSLITYPFLYFINNYYLEFYHLIFFFICGYFINGFSITSGVVLTISEKINFQAIRFFVSAIISISLNLYLVPILGLMGSAISFLITYLFLFIFGYIFLNRYLKITF